VCGTEPLRPFLLVPNRFNRASYSIARLSSGNQPTALKPELRRLIPVLVVLMAVMSVTSFSYKNYKSKSPKEAGAATADPTATSAQPKLENSGQRHIVHDSVKGVQQFVAGKIRTAEKIAAKEIDPVELWKAVKRGNVSAEVTLANLYLEGEEVAQNCEQAHMLLSAASMKGSKAADDYLKSSYAERCE
jgi:TPR repeat protein